MKGLFTTRVIILLSVTVIALFMLIAMVFAMSTFKSLKLTAGEGNGKVYGAGDYRKGSTVTINAEAAEGYKFDGWYEWNKIQGERKSASAKYTFYMPAHGWHLYAKFVKITTYGELYVEQELYDNLMTEPEVEHVKTESLLESAVVRLDAKSVDGFTFIGWYSEGRLVANDSSIVFNMPAQELYLSARYLEGNVTLYKLEAKTETGGSVEPQPRLPGLNVIEFYYPEGAAVVLTAKGNSFYEFVCWQAEDYSNDEAQIEFIMPGNDVTLIAKFEAVQPD